MGGTMKVIDDGSWADLLTPEHFVRMILNAVQTAWKTLSRPEESSHENPVTNRLCAALKVGSANANLPFHVDPQSTFLDEGGRVTGIPDIRFTPNVTRTGDDFYVVECKRLRFSYRGKCRSGNGDYIDGQGEGMTAFIDERYPAPHGYGAMVGYIFCSCTDPVGSVRGAISKKRELLRLRGKGTLLQSSLGGAGILETQHDLALGRVLTIQHVFLNADECEG